MNTSSRLTSKWLSMMIVGAVVFGVFELSMSMASADVNGPISRYDIVPFTSPSFQSDVYYSDYFVGGVHWWNVSLVSYGGRPWDCSGTGAGGTCDSWWKRYDTIFYEWNGSSWDYVNSRGASVAHSNGTTGSLAWYNDYDNLSMEGGAAVLINAEYYMKACTWFGDCETWHIIPSSWSEHYLE
jgi:hypothetical protein